MKLEVINGKWSFGAFSGLPLVVDIWFNCYRVIDETPKRSKISKENNYKFKSS